MEKDVELYKTWSQTRAPLDLEKLVKQLDPLIQSEVNKRAGSLSRNVLELQAKSLAVKAIKSYQPTLGIKLSTHVVNQIQKLSRMNYAHKDAARIPEHSMTLHTTFTAAQEDFMAENGREPSTEELADALRWSPKKVEQLRTQFGRSELVESKDSPSELFVPYEHDASIGYAYYSMSPRQQQIFEHTTGYQGNPILNNTKIMKKLSITQGVLSYEKNKINALLRESQ
jgi:DNA-directed RNA polymerase specialized sigma subunit